MATTLEIINGISQVLANSYDGALDESGEPIKIGLRREEGNPLIDHRIMDGFGANISGDRLHIKYHTEIPLKEVHSNGFEGEMESMVEKVKSFIQKEYNKVMKSSLSLSDPSEVDVLVEYVSRIRCSVKVHKCYKIGGLQSEENTPDSSERPKDPAFEKMVKLGGLK
ncbi:MAG: hypothetical protein CBD16_05290 [Betaproteobacteria bacterium TMED156]|nr:MAG: hypothetical protein CBD16_05290 [Betaproteobacteria bacterium TMED156]